jgi:hypothetical protein
MQVSYNPEDERSLRATERSLVTFATFGAHVLMLSPIEISKAFLAIETVHTGMTLVLNCL